MRIHLAFAGQDAAGYPSGMTVAWFTRTGGSQFRWFKFRVLGLSVTVYGWGLRGEGLRFRRFKGFWVQDSGFRVWGVERF